MFTIDTLLPIAKSQARKYAPSRFDRDDYLQELLLAMWQKRHRIRAQEPTHARKSLALIARNKALDLLRRKKMESRLMLPLSETFEAPDKRDALKAEVRVMIATAPPEQAAVYTEIMAGHSYRKTAQSLGITVSRVRSLLQTD